MLRSGERKNNIAEQDLRKSLKSYWPKKHPFRSGNFLLPPGKASRGDGSGEVGGVRCTSSVNHS